MKPIKDFNKAFEYAVSKKQCDIHVVSNHVCECTKTTQVNKINDSWICTECNRPIQQQQIVANVVGYGQQRK